MMTQANTDPEGKSWEELMAWHWNLTGVDDPLLAYRYAEGDARPPLVVLDVVGGGSVGGDDEQLAASGLVGDGRHRDLEPQGLVADRELEELLLGWQGGGRLHRGPGHAEAVGIDHLVGHRPGGMPGAHHQPSQQGVDRQHGVTVGVDVSDHHRRR